MKAKRNSVKDRKVPNRGRHEHGCRVCAHPKREEIEREWLDWGSTDRIARDYRLSRDSVYRHAHALDLFSRRDANVRRALYRIIERSEEVQPTASAVVAAVVAFAKINAAGKWIETADQVSVRALFERMTETELETYAVDGTLPHWFPQQMVATPPDGSEG